MGVYEERAPPTTGMHWVSVIPLFPLFFAYWPCTHHETVERGSRSFVTLASMICG